MIKEILIVILLKKTENEINDGRSKKDLKRNLVLTSPSERLKFV